MRKTTFTLAAILAVLLAGADGKLKDKPSESDFDLVHHRRRFTGNHRSAIG